MVLFTLPFASVREGIKHLPVWASWWDNPTYGTYGNQSYQTNKAYNPHFVDNPKGFMSQYYWLVIRNPANGLTQSPLFSVSQAECDYIKYKGNKVVDNGPRGWQFVYARKGWRLYTGLYVYKNFGEYRFGFKLLPDVPQRVRRVGMTFIPNPFKDIGK